MEILTITVTAAVIANALKATELGAKALATATQTLGKKQHQLLQEAWTGALAPEPIAIRRSWRRRKGLDAREVVAAELATASANPYAVVAGLRSPLPRADADEVVTPLRALGEGAPPLRVTVVEAPAQEVPGIVPEARPSEAEEVVAKASLSSENDRVTHARDEVRRASEVVLLSLQGLLISTAIDALCSDSDGPDERGKSTKQADPERVEAWSAVLIHYARSHKDSAFRDQDRVQSESSARQSDVFLQNWSRSVAVGFVASTRATEKLSLYAGQINEIRSEHVSVQDSVAQYTQALAMESLARSGVQLIRVLWFLAAVSLIAIAVRAF